MKAIIYHSMSKDLRCKKIALETEGDHFEIKATKPIKSYFFQLIVYGFKTVSKSSVAIEPLDIDFSKYADGLVPAIVQDIETSKVLMLGFMNAAAIETTLSTKKVTFSLGEPAFEINGKFHFYDFVGADIRPYSFNRALSRVQQPSCC